MEQHNMVMQTRKLFEYERAKQLRIFYITETIKLSPVIAPFYCLSVNMQNISSFLFNPSRIESMKIESNEKNTSRFRPFRVSYYKSYLDAFYDIYRQGILGIYKGNFYRLSFYIGSNQMKYFSDSYTYKLKVPLIFKDMLFYSLVDVLLHPLLFIESRYSVQNRSRNFHIYGSFLDVIRKSGKEIYNGASVSFMRNILFVLGLNVYYLYPSTYMNIFAVGLAHFLSYPMLTIQRNIIFQSNYIDYFPKVQYNGIKEHYNFIKNSLGFSFLYRGFISYSLATIIWHICVPPLAKSKFQKNYIQETDRILREENEDDEEEIFEKVNEKV